MEDHWFDTLNKTLVQDTPRRALLGTAALLTSLGAPLGAVAKKGKKGKKGQRNGNGQGNGKGEHKGKGKGKGRGQEKKKSKVTPRLCDPAIYTACSGGPDYVSGEPAHCEDTCDRCQQEGTAFCLVPTGADNFPRQPTCCHAAEDCCGGPFGECCTSDRCCQWEGGGRCLQPGETCCPEHGSGYCPPSFACCPGAGCVRCAAPKVLNLATCRCVDPDAWCPRSCVGPGLTCCDNGTSVACINTHGPDPDPNNCGGCDQPCIRPRWCCPGGICADIRVDREHCGFGCQECPPGQQCCHGRCLDALLECCRDSDRGVGFCSPGWTCCTLPDGANGCYGQQGCCDGRGNCY